MKNLKDLFKITEDDAQQSLQKKYNADSKFAGETYISYGKRICGAVNGSLPVLEPFLQRIYNSERNAQISNQQLQEQLKENGRQNLIQIDREIEQCENEKIKVENLIGVKNESVSELKGSIAELKEKTGVLNKDANAKMILGLIILIPLTIYLFVFYSSTFYSAFFRDFANAPIEDVGGVMFDPNALGNAWANGWTELVFVISAPVIFLGLGFCLHYFSVQEGKGKYFKSAMLVGVTLMFDSILAYKIGEGLYEVARMNTLESLPPYSVSLAIADVNTWAVIFCGFIVYIIWGIVFDMTYSGYEDRKSNSKQIEFLRIKIDRVNIELQELKQKITDLKNKMAKLNADKKIIQSKLAKTVQYDKDSIMVALADFFTGWIQIMEPLGKTKEEQSEAKNIYSLTINELGK